MIKEKIFSVAPINTTTFEEIEARRYAKLRNSPKELFNPRNREAKPIMKCNIFSYLTFLINS